MAYDPFTHRKKIPAFPSVFGPVAELQNDPAKMKSKFVGSGGVDAGYTERVSAFNKNLYQPSDRRSREETEAIYGPKKTAGPSNVGGIGKAEVADIGNQYRTPGSAAGRISYASQDLPDMPTTGAQGDVGPSGQVAIPEAPASSMVGAATPAPIVQQAEVDDIDDSAWGAKMMSDLDEMAKYINGIGGEQAQQQPEPPLSAEFDASRQSPIGARPRDTSWMYEKKDGWNGPQTESRNYVPAPVVFESSPSGGANMRGTALDERPQRSGPADSTIRYYQRAMDRAPDDHARKRIVQRLSGRINARPTND